MILKSLTRRNNTLQLVNYLFKQEKNEKPLPILKHNLRSRSAKGWAKEIDANEALRIQRRKDNIRLTHTILSFSDKDKEHISKELLKDIARKFVEIRGRDNIYLASSHHDKDHVHLHIIASGTKYLTGESNRISKKEFQELKLALDAYQREKYPILTHSLPVHGKPTKDRNKEPDQYREGNVSNKHQIGQAMEAAYVKSSSLEQFLTQLKSEGYEPYYRGGKLYGLENEEGRHFRFKTLGLDTNLLEDLDGLRYQEERELQELRDLRETKSIEKEEDYQRSDDEDSDGEEEDSYDDQEYDGMGI